MSASHTSRVSGCGVFKTKRWLQNAGVIPYMGRLYIYLHEWLILYGLLNVAINHQEFQVPKLEVLNFVRLFWWWDFPYISLIYSLYR